MFVYLTKRVGLCLAVVGLFGCNPQSSGFALPPGDAEQGKQTFVELQCNFCHSIAGEVAKLPVGHPELEVKLGGETMRVKTYGDLVTSIINPSHKIAKQFGLQTQSESGESKMDVYNDVMTVTELIDLTTFLQDTYDVVPPPYVPYRYGP